MPAATPFAPRPPSLSLCTVTDAPPAAATAFLEVWRPHVDEIVVAVDERAHPDTPGACREIADVVRVVPAAPFVERHLGWLLSRCRADWVLRMDDDELPSSALIDALPGLIASREHTHYVLPCRWLHPGPDRYAAADPWLSDLHPRLMRNVSGAWRVRGRVHSDVEVAGAGRIVDAPFLHTTVLVDSLATRQARVRRYEDAGAVELLDCGDPVRALYLPEEMEDLATAALPGADTERVRTYLEAAAGRDDAGAAGPALEPDVDMDEIETWLDEATIPEAAPAARVRLVHPIEQLTVGAFRHVQVEVTNAGATAWPPGRDGWPQVRVGHRWDSGDGFLHDPGVRGLFTERVRPGASTRLLVPIQAPSEPGTHALHVDVVEEHVRWFDHAAVEKVTVLPARSGPAPVAQRTRISRRRRAPDQAKVFADDLRRLHDVLAGTAFGERYWVWGGLLLGWARERAPLAHDLHDADFAFTPGEGAGFADAARALMGAGFAPHKRFCTNSGKPTQWSFLRNGAKFEFWALEPEDGLLRYHVYGDDPPMQAVGELPAQPLRTFRFLRRRWRKHADHERELSAHYGDWRTPDPSWGYLGDGCIVSREPWQRPNSAWQGDLEEPCTP